MKSVFFSLILALIFGGAVVAVNAQTTQQATVNVNQQKKFSRSKLTIKLVSVEDSRCPRDVNCVWAGNAKAVFKISSSKGKSQTFNLNTNLEARAVKFEGYEIKLGEVTPYPRSSIEIKQNEYAVTFVVTKL